jgi:hypothetical protein
MLRNITLSADKNLIEQARRRAESQRTTLNAEFRRWLEHYVEDHPTNSDLSALMDRLSYVRPGKTFTRDELNER